MTQLEMTQEQRAAHERLLERLPSRTRIDGLMKPVVVRTRRSHWSRPVIISGRLYRSIRAAARSLRVQPSTVQYHLRRKRKGWRYA